MLPMRGAKLTGPVIFRLADTLTDLGPQACAAHLLLGGTAAKDTVDNIDAPHDGKEVCTTI